MAEIQTELQSVNNSIETELAKMRTHIHISHIGLYVILALVLSGGGFFLSRMVSSYDKAVAAADAKNTILVQAMQDMNKSFIAHDSERAANEKQVQVIDHVITVRDKSAATKVAEVTATDRTVAQTIEDSSQILKVTPVQEADNLLGVSQPAMQGFVGTKLDDDEAHSDLADTRTQLSIEEGNNASLKVDLSTSKDTLKKCTDTVDGYKKAAKKSKWRKGLDVIEKVALFAGGVYLGKIG